MGYLLCEMRLKKKILCTRCVLRIFGNNSKRGSWIYQKTLLTDQSFVRREGDDKLGSWSSEIYIITETMSTEIKNDWHIVNLSVSLIKYWDLEWNYRCNAKIRKGLWSSEEEITMNLDGDIAVKMLNILKPELPKKLKEAIADLSNQLWNPKK